MNDIYIKQIMPAPENAYVIHEIEGEKFEEKIVCLALLSNDLVVFMHVDDTGDIHEVDTSHEQFVRIVYK